MFIIALNKPKVQKPQQLMSIMSPFVSARKLVTDSSRTGHIESPMASPTVAFDDMEPKSPSNKPKLNEILLKHRNILKLKTVASVVKENLKKNSKGGVEFTIDRQNTDGFGDEDAEKNFEKHKLHKINSMIKDVNSY